MWENVVWPRPGAHPGARQQKARLGPSSVYRDQMRFDNKTSDITQQDAIGVKQSHQQ